jgi:hypothetical protein
VVTAASPTGRTWTLAAVGVACALALGLSWCIARSPLTLYDGLGPVLDARRSPSVYEAFRSSLGSVGYLRPLRIVQIKVAYDRFPSNPTRGFKAIHVGLTFAALVLFALWIRPRSPEEFVAAAIALVLLVGHHSYFTLFSEAYPINHFLEMVALSVAAALLARGAPRWWKSALIAVLLAIGLATLESGLLIAVVTVVCWTVGWRGVSGGGVLVSLAVVAAYLWIRFGVLEVTSPGLDERAAGWWLARLEPEELIARFQANPLPFYAYNVFAALLDVLLSQPRTGTFFIIRRWIENDASPWMFIHILSSLLVTGLLLVALVPALKRWRARALEDRDRFVLLAFALVVANSALSYGYVKDEVLSVGTTFYAGGAFAVVASLAGQDRRTPFARYAATLLLVAVSVLWSSRAAGTFFALRSAAFKTATDWGLYSLERELPNDWAFEPTRMLFFEMRRRNIEYSVSPPLLTNERDVSRWVEIQ